MAFRYNQSSSGSDKYREITVVFKDPSSVTKALVVNNREVGDRHLLVDRANPTLFDPKRSVFIGSLPHYTDEEELRKHFAEVGS